MTTRALITTTLDLQPHPPPYGKLYLSQGAWDALQARRAYQETLADSESSMPRSSILDRAV
jgi:hypothetical protein